MIRVNILNAGKELLCNSIYLNFVQPALCPQRMTHVNSINGLPWSLASKCVLSKGSPGRSEEGGKRE